MPRKVTMQGVRQHPVIRKHVIGLILCGAALVLDVTMSFSPIYWYYRYDVIRLDSSSFDLSKLTSLSRRHINFDISNIGGSHGSSISKSYGININIGDSHGSSSSKSKLLRISTSIGLWQVCASEEMTDSDPVTNCWMQNEDGFRSVGGIQFATVSFIGSAGAFGVGLKNDSSSSMDLTENVNFSFAFAVISGVVALAGAVALLIAARCDKAEPERTTQLQF